MILIDIDVFEEDNEERKKQIPKPKIDREKGGGDGGDGGKGLYSIQKKLMEMLFNILFQKDK